jgi:hypothetical protein
MLLARNSPMRLSCRRDPGTATPTSTIRTPVSVISGALLLAVGTDPDKRFAKRYPAGSYVFVPANLEHTMGADVDTIIIGAAAGPWKTHNNAEPHHH